MSKKIKISGNSQKIQQQPDKKKKSAGISLRKVSKTAALIVAIIIFGTIALFTTVMVMANSSDLRASRAEYNFLREIASDIKTETDESDTQWTDILDYEMRQINNDYVAWIQIDGTGIDYPVVRGSDNSKYIKTSFTGEQNIAGAVFMDYRNTGNMTSNIAGEFMPHIILFGHNLQQGGMFSDLHKMLNTQFLEENRIIKLTVNGQPIYFEIFSARRTDINDSAFFLNFNSPQDFPRFLNRIDAPLRATQIITLSTCVGRGNNDDRVVVQGYRLFD